ncbi:MAG: hypothetical protein IPL39_08150 [Opitutaceae bacterium]|nr:hypothetical protein [Opitutaceae bacterium]
MLATGIPQLARSLHDELDRTAGGFLWEFLEKNWVRLWPDGVADAKVVERLVRRRAALQLAEIGGSAEGVEPISSVAGLEYYTYPPLHSRGFKLGHIIQRKQLAADIRVVLTPHCHLTIQQAQTEPRAKYVLTIKTSDAKSLIGDTKRADAKSSDILKREKKLRGWATPPSGQDVGFPEGRFWFLPAFLDIPHCYCDFQQLETIPYADIASGFTSIASLTPPFAESLQSCFLAYYSGVGIPNIKPESITSLLD